MNDRLTYAIMLNLLILKYTHLQFVIMLSELKKVLSRELKCSKRSSYSRSSTMESMEKNVECLNRGTESMPCACKHAYGSGQGLIYLWGSIKGDDNVKPSSASTGGFSRFTKRYNFCNIKMTGEAVSADADLNGNTVFNFVQFDLCNSFQECTTCMKWDLPVLFFHRFCCTKLANIESKLQNMLEFVTI